jgi:hypothetical protein
MATPAERYRALREAVDFLESAVDHLSDHLGRPDQVVGGKFRYAEQSAWKRRSEFEPLAAS